MVLLEILLVVFGALIVGALFFYVFRSAGPWGTFWSFLLVLILAGVAADAWITPVGPVAWGIAWIPLFLVLIIFALILAAATPPEHRRLERERTTRPETSEEETAAVAIGGFFWLLMILLLIIAVWGYVD